MKKHLLLSALMASAVSVFGQGQVVFNNRVQHSGPDPPTSAQFTPIYGINPSNPTEILTGQGSGGLSIPSGTTDYSGRALLSGTGFTAQLWYGAVGTASDDLVLASGATSTFRTGTFTVGFFNGSIATLDNPAAMIPGGPGTRAVFLVRAWDNMGGTVTSWAAVLANPAVARGASPAFVVGFDLGGNGFRPPDLYGLVSFGLFIVPEPSAVALGLLGAVLLVFARRTHR